MPAQSGTILFTVSRYWRRRRVRHPALSFVAVLSVGTVFFSLVEGWRLLDALYFCISTVTMLGYGDISPKTDLGKVGAMLYAIFGIAVFLMLMERLVLQRDVEEAAHEAEPDIRAPEGDAGAGTRRL